MGKRIRNATTSAWQRFMILDRQSARTAGTFTETGLDERQSMTTMPDYAAIKAYADSEARTAGF